MKIPQPLLLLLLFGVPAVASKPTCCARLVPLWSSLNTKTGSTFDLDRTILLRGGSFLEEEDTEEEDEYDFEDHELEGLDDLDKEDFDFRDDAYRETTAPFSDCFLMASFAIPAMWNNRFPSFLKLDWYKVIHNLQLWRPLTAFLDFGSIGPTFLLRIALCSICMNGLERMQYKTPYDFWIMILWGVIFGIIGSPIQSGDCLGPRLSSYLLYIWSRSLEGERVKINGFIVQAEQLPWFLLAEGLFLEDGIPVSRLLGIVFGHLYYHFKTVGLLRAPQALIEWYKSDSATARELRKKYQAISEDFE